MPLGLSDRAFAKLDGCTHTLVAKGKKSGHLPVLADGSLDSALAGTGWRAGNRGNAALKTGKGVAAPVTGPSAVSITVDHPTIHDDETPAEAAERIVAAGHAPLTLAEAERVKENYLALLRQLEYETKSGTLVQLAATEAVFFTTARENRDAWTGWAPRVAPEAAAELGVDPRALSEVLNRLVQQHLTELGEPDFDLGREPAEA